MRKFDTGATRDDDTGKFDYWGFESPLADEAFAQYMHKHRQQADGQMRASDNWKKGLPIDSYQRSFYRHAKDFKKAIEAGDGPLALDIAQAIRFNIQGWTHEYIKSGGLLETPMPTEAPAEPADEQEEIQVVSAITGERRPLRPTVGHAVGPSKVIHTARLK